MKTLKIKPEFYEKRKEPWELLKEDYTLQELIEFMTSDNPCQHCRFDETLACSEENKCWTLFAKRYGVEL